MSKPDIETKLAHLKRGTLREAVTEDELRQLLQTHDHPSLYIGFEISGKVHIATGLLTALKLKDFMAAGIQPTIFLADYHAYINGKLGGDLPKIQQVAKGYFKSAMQASLRAAGMDEAQAAKVKFVLASDLYEELGGAYWKDVMAIAKDTTMKRMLRCTTIMGRTESDALPSSAFLYPAMQAADIWALEADIAYAGMDQRKVHMLAREWAEKAGRKKPVALHGMLLGGLTGPGRMDPNASDDDKMMANKMSKSNPDSCLFVHDSEAEIARKFKGAYCPQKVVEDNPILQYAEAFVLREMRRPDGGVECARPLRIERPEKFGGNVEFASKAELEAAFLEGKLHPMDLKNAVAKEMAALLKPARDHFEAHQELLDQAL